MGTVEEAELVMKEQEQARTTEEEPAAVTSKSCSDTFFEQCSIVSLLLTCAHYIGTVYILLKYCDSKWLSLGLTACVTPYFGAVLYAILYFKAEHTEKYATGSPA